MSGPSMLGLLQGLMADISQSAVSLGPFNFEGHEVPSQISIGGRQAVAVHRLPGGARVIDVMGPDESAIQWTGLFTGVLASERARALDDMRRTGFVFTLTIGDYVFQVIIVQFDYVIRDRGTVLQYRIRLDIVPQPTLTLPDPSAGLLTQLSVDLASAVAGLPTAAVPQAALESALQSATAQAARLTAGTMVTQAGSGGSTVAIGTGLAAAGIELGSAIDTASQQLAPAGGRLTASSILSRSQGAGTLAFCVQSAGYLNRANGFLRQLDGLPPGLPLVVA